MSLYKTLRPLLFALPPEAAHAAAMRTLQMRLCATGAAGESAPLPAGDGGRRVMGLDFFNPVGLAAGFDKSGEYVDALGQLGFGFIEVGAVTPKPQAGTAGRRVFRLPAAAALINRMGFNNAGAETVAQNLRRRQYKGIVGINLGKNADTPEDKTAEDYIYCLEKLYEAGDFFTVNISSPNTPGLRSWLEAGRLEKLLAAVANSRDALAKQHGQQGRKPLALKVSPDADDESLRRIAKTAANFCDALIACNTTTARPPEVSHLPGAAERGGLSGRPLAARSTEVIKLLRGELSAEIAIIGVGGIFSPADAAKKLAAGADLIQIYTGLIYEGWRLPANIINQLSVNS